MKIKEADTKYLLASAEPSLHISAEIASVVESVARKYESEAGKKDGWESDELPWKALREQAVKSYRMLREGHPSTAFGQLLRAGVQMIANAWYKRYPTTWQDVALETTSDKRQEFHAPLFGSAYPRRVGDGNPFREQQVKGQDIEVINVKWGGIEAFDRELFDDDQTGQIRNRASQLGESMKNWQDAYFIRRFIGAAFGGYPDPIPASTWAGVNANGTAIATPFSVNMYATLVGNRPAAFVQFSEEAVMAAFNALRRAVDPLNVPIVIRTDTLLHSSFDELTIKRFLNSAYYPSVGPAQGGGEQGLMKGIFSVNVFQGAFKPVMNIHAPMGMWALGEGKKGFTFQRRDPLEIIQEMPGTGQNFEVDVYRFRSRERWEQAWIDPRFWYLGNDGTAALTR